MTADELLDRLRAFEGRSYGPAVTADDPVNVPMIRHWVEAMGDTNPVYLDDGAAEATGRPGIVAPAVMLQVWSMRGLKSQGPRADGVQSELLGLLEEHGFTSVVATNTEQEYLRELVPGDLLATTSVIESVSEEKATGLGVGHFVTTRTEYRDQDGELVGAMTFRILKFRPRPKAEPKPNRPRPAVNLDNAFFFEGAKDGKLLIQKCSSCGALRHPPGPLCPQCQSLDWEAIEASGQGTVYSFVTNHYPQVPAFDYPLNVALIELDEGVRLISNVVGIDADAVEIGMPVAVVFTAFDDELTLPQFQPVGR
ncbi:MAG TPA: bifunctional MaoC family dehydratase N-terminal/OB-fold nucleic acid binding domain-containing protein [Acidimicrobiales bacterium]